MKYHTLIFCILIILACKTEDFENVSNPIITFSNQLCEAQYLMPKSIVEANFKSFYVGPKIRLMEVNVDTPLWQNAILDRFYKKMNIQDANLMHILKNNPIEADPTYLTITIDTAQLISTTFTINEKKQVFGRKNICVFQYPVIIENTYPSFFKIGYGDELSFVLEAKNTLGKWQTISHPPILFCGTGLGTVSLASKDIAISLLPVLSGGFTTTFRLKLGRAYSNEISMSIDSILFEPSLLTVSSEN